MLFIIAMDALNLLFDKAETMGILAPFPAGHPISQRLSIYADDVIVFLKTSRVEAAKLV
jgi:hypothetical protein